jgi:hypothetical protein
MKLELEKDQEMNAETLSVSSFKSPPSTLPSPPISSFKSHPSSLTFYPFL